ncbi:MAG TPA: DUF2844 domain-containing protein [Casimicrobiaceae bacterium]|nr:DUF2844 domain-containing protein [Casimicrobiaceae bacterium]
MKRPAGSKITLALAALLAMPAARGALGDVEASIEVDRLAMHAMQQTTRTPRFTMHELRAPSGTTVREYVSPAGTVFGVAWQGPTLPDLRQLLGAHFDEYAAAAAERRTRRSPVLVQLPGLVVQSAGHMRAFVGKAYIPQALPPGVAVAEIQ